LQKGREDVTEEEKGISIMGYFTIGLDQIVGIPFLVESTTQVVLQQRISLGVTIGWNGELS
jgi:hypothetical protein